MGADLYGAAGAYFRDSYNSTNLLWQFGLSWWQDIIPMLDADGLLQPARVAELSKMLGDREDQFKANIADLRRRDRHYFTEKRVELLAFLQDAIRANEAVRCSL